MCSCRAEPGFICLWVSDPGAVTPLVFFFFFQAEDGIRDKLVTGVQTCALPILRTPSFEPAKVELAKRQALEAIRRRPDSPAGIAGREFRKLLYGADHPLGRESTIATVSRITSEDLVAFHRQ